MMTGAISIRPSKDLRTNYAQISQLCRQNPVAITVNGREDVVVISHEDYVEIQNQMADLERRLAMYTHLAQAADDIKMGRVQDADEAMDEIIRELGELRR